MGGWKLKIWARKMISNLMNNTKNQFLIYRAFNIVNGKSYIGYTSKTLNKRISQHLASAQHGDNSFFHNALLKYGLDSFDWMILDECRDAETARILECHYINEFNSFEGGYNLTVGGEGGAAGRKWTDEQRQEACDNSYPRTKEWRDRQRKAIATWQDKITETKQSEEYRSAARERNLGAQNPCYGRKHSKKELRELKRRATGVLNPFFGKHHTDESNEKNRIKHLGKFAGEKNPFYGHHHTKEEIKKMVDYWDNCRRCHATD